jgi:hypothetical protein
MTIINNLHPKRYEYRQDGNYKLMNLPKGSHYGLIAQEVEKVLPNLVRDTKFSASMATPPKQGEEALAESQGAASPNAQGSETINFKALNYTELIPIMIKGLQEQQQQINELKKTIEQLR